MLSLAPWFYRNLLVQNDLMTSPEFFGTELVNNKHVYEANIFLHDHLRPAWLKKSEIYKNCDGSGASEYKNIAVYKSISEALERLAFYELVESTQKKYCFDLNPTTTGMAAFPQITTHASRENAKTEAVERWALHEFNKFKLPIIQHSSLIPNLFHYELTTPFKNIKVSLIAFKTNNFYAYGFAGGSNLNYSFDRAIIELSRNVRVLSKIYVDLTHEQNFSISTDKTIFYFSTQEGFDLFQNKIHSSSSKIINNNPKILCDLELKGYWSKYTKVWRFLLEDSYYPCHEDHTFFMF